TIIIVCVTNQTPVKRKKEKKKKKKRKKEKEKKKKRKRKKEYTEYPKHIEHINYKTHKLHKLHKIHKHTNCIEYINYIKYIWFIPLAWERGSERGGGSTHQTFSRPRPAWFLEPFLSGLVPKTYGVEGKPLLLIMAIAIKLCLSS
ncbi:MAG: hypothetical protein ACP6IQ_01790, partial [Candidatus Njordarchaeia archaeon]